MSKITVELPEIKKYKKNKILFGTIFTFMTFCNLYACIVES